jgi:integrase
MSWEHINWNAGQYGSIYVPHGKTAAARRTIFLSPRVRFVLEHRWELAGTPLEGWIWPASTTSEHFDQSTIKKRLERNLQRCDENEKEGAVLQIGNLKKKSIHVRRFIPYNLRHTFLTRLGESGCDPWTLAKIAGHSNISISSRYVHPSEEALSQAFSNPTGHKIGHRDEFQEISAQTDQRENVESNQHEWCARRDSNSRPNAPEAFALSS